MITIKDIKSKGGTCQKVATDFWECTDRNGKVWWCSDGGNACVEKPKISMTISDLEDEGGKCTEMAEDVWLCKHPDGKVWACNGNRNESTCIIVFDPEEEKSGREIDAIPNGISTRLTENRSLFEVTGRYSVKSKEGKVDYSFSFVFDLEDNFINGEIELGSGENQVFKRVVKKEKDGYLNSITTFGPKIKGGKELITQAKAASSRSVVVTGAIDEMPFLPMAFVNKNPGKTNFGCCDGLLHSPLLSVENEKINFVNIDPDLKNPIEKIVEKIRSDSFKAGFRSDLIFPSHGMSLWPGRKYWCILACATAAAACIAGTAGSAAALCLIAQAACEAACL